MATVRTVSAASRSSDLKIYNARLELGLELGSYCNVPPKYQPRCPERLRRFLEVWFRGLDECSYMLSRF